MILYHFLNAKYGLEAIRNRRLKIARILELNDPFEFLGVNLSDQEHRKALNKTKKSISKDAGILCFSEIYTNPLLWGHYGDKHKGMCLGFEVPKDAVGKVHYVDSRLEFPRLNQLDEDFMKNLLYSKFSHWEYEKEHRIWVSLKEEIYDLQFVGFSDANLTLKYVIVGEKSNITRDQVSDALGTFVGRVKKFKVRKSFRSFKMVKNTNSALWT